MRNHNQFNSCARVLFITLSWSGAIFCAACTKSSSSSPPSPEASSTTPTVAGGTVPPGDSTAASPTAGSDSTPVAGPTPTPVATSTVVAPPSTPAPFATIKAPTYPGAQLKGSPLPELDGSWKLKEIACVAGTLLPAANDLIKALNANQLARRLSIRGSTGALSYQRFPDPAKSDTYCLAKSPFVMTFFPSDVELRFDKASYAAIGNPGACSGDVAAESWVSTVYITGDTANVLLIVRDEKSATEKFCSDGISKLIFVRE